MLYEHNKVASDILKSNFELFPCEIRRIQFISVILVHREVRGLVVRVSGYRYRGPGFDPRRYQIF